jgi:hypothetical protein
MSADNIVDDLEFELKAVEQELAEQFGDDKKDIVSHDNQPIVEETPAPMPVNKKPKKQDLIARILQLQSLIDDYDTKAPSYYQRMKVAELQNILAEMTNLAGNQLTFAKPNEKKESSDDADEPERVETKKRKKPTNQMAGRVLFSFNMLVVNFLEASSIKIEPKLRTSLRGLSDDVYNNEQELTDILTEIYEENEDWMEALISPTNRYLFLMGRLSVNRLMSNKIEIAKKNETGSNN